MRSPVEQRLCEASPEDLLLGEAVSDALFAARIPLKVAVAVMGIPEAHFRKALRGEGYRLLALNHLIKLPYAFWLFFGPALMWIVAKKHAAEIADTVAVRLKA